MWSAIAFGYRPLMRCAARKRRNARQMAMKLHQLRDLVAIAEHGSLRAAARHLGIAQPTLTRSLSELERELGAPLFERRARGMVATALGQAFIRRAIAIVND